MATFHTEVLTTAEKEAFRTAFYDLLKGVKDSQRNSIAEEMAEFMNVLVSNAAYFKFKLFNLVGSDEAFNAVEHVMYKMIAPVPLPIAITDKVLLAREMAFIFNQCVFKHCVTI